MDILKQNFCAHLKKWKDDVYKGTVGDLAKELKVSQGQMSNILAGRKCPNEVWRRFVAEKIGVPYQNMIGINEDSQKNDSNRNTDTPIPLDAAIQILQEALEETGVKINDKQKEAVIKILREELKESGIKTKNGIMKYLEAFGK